MRIVLVHGMRQEGRNPDSLRRAWSKALDRSWRTSGLAKPVYTTVMPFFGDELHRLTEEVRGSGRAVTSKGEGDPGLFDPLEEAILREMAATEGISDGEIRAELGQEIVAKGPANWEWVQAIARRLEDRVPAFRDVGLRFVRQVDAYLTRPHITEAVDAIVEPALLGSPDVVIAHSLGSIVSYRILQKLAVTTAVKLFVTLGSPLGIHAVKDWIRPPPLGIPEGVRRWVNGADQRDYVALHARLDRTTFCDGIENLADFHNRQEDAHFIGDYLADHRIAEAISQI